MTEGTPGRGIRFRESMPRPLLITFLATGVIAVGFIVWLLVSPPTPRQLDIGSRRSAPSTRFSHDVVEAVAAPIPTPFPAFSAPCAAVDGIVVEGGEAAHGRIAAILRDLCRIEGDETEPPEVRAAIRALSKATIRFAVFTRTGEQSTFELATGRILINVDLARTSVNPVVIAPLLVHEGWHLASGTVTATQEYKARLAEFQACRVVYRDIKEPSRGCLDAQAIVALGETRAVELFVRSGFPR